MLEKKIKEKKNYNYLRKKKTNLTPLFYKKKKKKINTTEPC